MLLSSSLYLFRHFYAFAITAVGDGGSTPTNHLPHKRALPATLTEAARVMPAPRKPVLGGLAAPHRPPSN